MTNDYDYVFYGTPIIRVVIIWSKCDLTNIKIVKTWPRLKLETSSSFRSTAYTPKNLAKTYLPQGWNILQLTKVQFTWAKFDAIAIRQKWLQHLLPWPLGRCSNKKDCFCLLLQCPRSQGKYSRQNKCIREYRDCSLALLTSLVLVE